MKTIRGDLFKPRGADAICLTTNGIVKADGACVMGRGCAAEAKRRWPAVEYVLGNKINVFGNICHVLTRFTPTCLFLPVDHTTYEHNTIPLDYHVVSFPVKHHWRDVANLQLIEKSAIQLISIIDSLGWEKVILPRPGCGNGRLKWKTVKSVLEGILDDRVRVIHFPKTTRG